MTDDHECRVKGCDRLVYSKGLCSAHYRRKRTLGSVQAHKPLRIAKYPDDAICTACGDRRVYAKNLCPRCYQRGKG